MALIGLTSMVLDHQVDLAEAEMNFVSKVFIQDKTNYAELVPSLQKTFVVSERSDFVDDVMSSPVWEKLSRAMEPDFDRLWSEKCLFYRMPDQVLLALNSRLSSRPSVFSSAADASKQRSMLIRNGYDGSLTINHFRLQGAIYKSSTTLVLHDYPTIVAAIMSQDVGVHCGSSMVLSKAQQRQLEKFCRMNFSISHFRRKLDKCNYEFPIASKDVGDFVCAIIDKYVARRLIGSLQGFNRMKRNIRRCLGMGIRRPMSLGMLMKGLPFYRYPQNVFFAKLVLFLAQLFANQLVKRLLYATESPRTRKLLYFLPEMWKRYEKKAVATMVQRGTLRKVKMPWKDGRITRLRISFKAGKFRPLVLASSHHKMTRSRLSVCNALLKQVVHSINPSYGRTLNQIHTQWLKLNKLPKGKTVYFVRTDISDAFPSIDHAKLHEILTRRLSSIDPSQICRTVEYQSKGRRKSTLLFTTLSNRLSKQKIYCESRKKVFTTAYLKAVVLQYIKQNYITMNNKAVYHQAKGLPQGCHLSPILCELYLSDLDSNVFTIDDETSGTRLIRAVDDYLFITTDAKKAEQFLQIIKTGVPEYNINFQRTKTVTNVGPPTDTFGFYGYCFQPSCRKIGPDFTNFAGDLGDRMFLSPKMTWSDLTRRMETVASLKIHKVIVDSNYLHKFAILKNVYLCARLHAQYYRTMHDFLALNRSTPPFAERIAPISAGCHALAKKIVQINRDSRIVSYAEAEFAAYTAYSAILPNFRQQLRQKLDKIELRTRSRKLMRSLRKLDNAGRNVV